MLGPLAKALYATTGHLENSLGGLLKFGCSTFRRAKANVLCNASAEVLNDLKIPWRNVLTVSVEFRSSSPYPKTAHLAPGLFRAL